MTRLVGSNGDDAFAGLYQNDQLYGLGGNDYIFGGDGNDRISGGAGNDELHGDYGNDALYGGAGNDSLEDTVGDDALLRAGTGDDQLVGVVGQLYGEQGNDVFFTWGRQDIAVSGGQGADTFNLQLDGAGAFNGEFHTVEVKDFNPAQGDRLNLSAYDGYGNRFEDSAVRAAFDDNHDGKLTAADTYVDTDAAGDGTNLNWWGVTLHLDHVQELAVTTAATDFLM